MSAAYYLRTYDYDLEEYTPQVGVSPGPYTLWQLRTAIRELRDLGYTAHRRGNTRTGHDDSDSDTMIERREERPEWL